MWWRRGPSLSSHFSPYLPTLAMTLPIPNPNTPLSEEEWAELQALKEGINEQPAAFIPGMERFTSLLIRSMRERGA